MTLPDYRAGDLWEHKRKLATARKALLALPRERELALRAILGNDQLTEAQKEIRTKRVRREYARKFEQLKTAANTAFGSAQEAVREMRVNRLLDAGAQGRVRRLLERGLAPSKVLERAVELKDADTIAALRAEALYWGDGDKFIDAIKTIEACDRALAEVGTGNEAEHNQAALDLAELSGGLPEIERFAALSVQDAAKPGRDRLRLAYALIDEERGDG